MTTNIQPANTEHVDAGLHKLRVNFDRIMANKQDAQKFFTFQLTAPRVLLLLLAQEQAIDRYVPPKEIHRLQGSPYYDKVSRLRFNSAAYQHMYLLCQRAIFFSRSVGRRVNFRAYAHVRRSLQQTLDHLDAAFH